MNIFPKFHNYFNQEIYPELFEFNPLKLTQ